MKHKKIRKKFILYLDGDLPETERNKIEQHLSGCESCKNALKAIDELWNNEKMYEASPPESLWYKLNYKLEEKRIKKTAGLDVNKKLIFNIAATVTLIVISVFTGSRLGVSLNPSVNNENIVYHQSGEVRDDFGINYFDVLPPNSIAEEVFLTASNSGVNK